MVAVYSSDILYFYWSAQCHITEDSSHQRFYFSTTDSFAHEYKGMWKKSSLFVHQMKLQIQFFSSFLPIEISSRYCILLDKPMS
jgi:hypothetical protein